MAIRALKKILFVVFLCLFSTAGAASAKTFVETADFGSLVERNTATPGFGKADFVSYYIEFKEKSL